ncbi:tRNA (cytosine(34)-C(5))-methyltransferase-like protein, partial [Dinothrombium tinctorium]
MGKKKKRANRGDDRDKSSAKNKKAYDDIVKENANFEAYYKQQNIIAENEWSTFMEIIREPLPASFRITNTEFNQTKALQNIVRSQAFEDLAEDKSFSISCLKWYPNELAFQMKLSRVEIRKSECLQRLHNFLISETESGYISRQEAVSMIPPLLLDVEAGHKVLDTCASPGSKTAQIIEGLHSKANSVNEGVVVANDVDNKRCYMLVHQSKRLHSPSFLIVNHDAGSIPNFYNKVNGENVKMKFDRILCDVPCSGDGTIRKNHDVWVKWSVANGNNFHGIQSRIVKRSLELLNKGGIMVYSTCSLNPMEDEAVIASTLVQCEGGLELVDVSDKLRWLKYTQGLETWKVIQRDMKVVNSIEELDKNLKSQIREAMFPPKNVKDLNLKRCVRILPHQQDTGGFFVAVLKKLVDVLPWEKENSESDSYKVPPKKKLKGFKEDPFFFFQGDEEEWLKIKSFYRISNEFPANQLMYRSSNGKKRNIYYLSNAAKSIVCGSQNLRIINGGVRIFSRIDDKVCSCSYRITQEGLSSIYPYISPEILVTIDKNEIELILKNESVLNENLREVTQQKLSQLPSGCCVLVYKQMIVAENEQEEEMLIPFCGWKGKTTLR